MVGFTKGLVTYSSPAGSIASCYIEIFMSVNGKSEKAGQSVSKPFNVSDMNWRI